MQLLFITVKHAVNLYRVLDDASVVATLFFFLDESIHPFPSTFLRPGLPGLAPSFFSQNKVGAVEWFA
jgi:hypothetical protein